MGHSLYEIDCAKDYSKPSDVLDEPNYYLQDVFYQTRPEVFNFDKKPGEGSPFYQNYPIDDAIRNNLRDEFRDNYNDETIFNDWGGGNLVEGSLEDARRILSLYRLEHGECTSVRYSYGPNIKKAISLKNLAARTSEFSKKKAPGCNARLIENATNIKNNRFVYRVKSFERESDPSGHIVTVQLHPKKGQTRIMDIDVEISCSCKFWQFWGPDFNAQRGDYLEGDPTSTGGLDSSDPYYHLRKKNLICKHVLAVSKVFERFANRYKIRVFRELKDIIDDLKDETLSEQVKYVTEFISDNARRKIEPYLKRLETQPHNKELQKTLKVKMLVLKI